MKEKFKARINKHTFIVLVVILLALVVRVMGIYPGYPQIHPDEGTSYHTAVYLLYHWFHPDRFDYPAGMAFIHLTFYIIFFIPAMLLKLFLSNPSKIIGMFTGPINFFTQHEANIFGNAHINAMYWSRFISALFGTLAVGITYMVAKRLFNKWVGLFAAVFLTFNFRHVLGSHFGLPDIMSSFFAMLTLFASILLLEKNNRKRYLFAGLVAGLYFSLKYQPFAFLPFFTVHLLWTIKKRSFLYLFYRPFIESILLSILVFMIINPYYLFNLDKAMYHNSIDFKRYQMGVFRFRAYPLFYLYHWGIGKLPFITILGGIVAMLFSRPKKFLLPISFVGVYMFFMILYSNGGVYSRNFIQVMPFFMLFAGYLFYAIHAFLRKFLGWRMSAAMIALLLIAVNFDPAKNSFILGREYSKPWTIPGISGWLEETIPENVTLRDYPLYIPSKTVLALQEKNVRRLSWQYEKGPNTLVEFQQEHTDFAIINTYPYQSAIYYWRDSMNPYLFLQIEGIPFDFLENSFYGISLRELMQYTVYEIYKPWQAQEASNFLVFKIPEKPLDIGKKTVEFRFNTSEELWKLKSNFDFDLISLEWDKDEGRNQKGSLKMSKKEGLLVSSRYASNPIPINAGKLYTVKGWIKNSIPRFTDYDRDGFLRMDFYTNDNEEALNTFGVGAGISQRATVTPDGKWVEVQSSMVAPQKAKYLTISFQLKEGNYYSLYLDDVELYESDNIPQEPFNSIPYIRPTIPKESLYYNSFL